MDVVESASDDEDGTMRVCNDLTGESEVQDMGYLLFIYLLFTLCFDVICQLGCYDKNSDIYTGF